MARNPKSGASRVRYEKYKAATTVGEYLELSDSTSKGWQDMLNDWMKGYVTIQASALVDLLPRHVQIVLTCLPEIELFSVFGLPERLPPADLSNLSVPPDDFSYSEQTALIRRSMNENLIYNLYMSSTGYTHYATPCGPSPDSLPPVPSTISAYPPFESPLPLIERTVRVTPSSFRVLSTESTFDEFCDIASEDIENFIRRKNFMPEIPYDQQEYLKLGGAFLADLAPPGVMPSANDPKTTRELLAHPEKARLIDAAISEIDRLVNVHKVLRLVPIQRYYDVLHHRGKDLTKMLNSVLILTTKMKIVGGTITNPGQTRVSRVKGRLAACERRDQNHYDNGVSSPSSDLAAARMFFCIVLVHKLEI